jgi:hypothetical protein
VTATPLHTSSTSVTDARANAARAAVRDEDQIRSVNATDPRWTRSGARASRVRVLERSESSDPNTQRPDAIERRVALPVCAASRRRRRGRPPRAAAARHFCRMA